MMDELKISLAEVSECASKIRNFNQMKGKIWTERVKRNTYQPSAFLEFE